MQDLNPGFDGKVTGFDGKGTPFIENGVVTTLGFLTDNVTDISPVRAFMGLKLLNCDFSNFRKSEVAGLSDLSPLKGMPLTHLTFNNTHVADLSPLQGMKLALLAGYGANVADLSPLKDMPLTSLIVGSNPVSDLSPLQKMSLTSVNIQFTLATDLSPLQGMPLTTLSCDVTNVTDHSLLKDMPLTHLSLDFKPEPDTELLRSIETLETINGKPVAQFWNEVEWKQAGEKKLLDFRTPAFDPWRKDLAGTKAEEQVQAVTKSLQVFNQSFDGKITPNIENNGQVKKLKANYLRLTGYRLPTEAEMEYVTRAGAVTARYYGETEELLPNYAWYQKNSEEKTWPVGGLKPNDLGLFDVHGNVFTWCQERCKYFSQGDEASDDNEDEELEVRDTIIRVMRGGSHVYSASYLRSANRITDVPSVLSGDFGFRVARTYP